MNFLKPFTACLMLSVLVGCSSKPSNSESQQLGYQYLTSMVPGIKTEEISVLKTYMKDESPVVVLQAGDMICEMPVLKGKDGWIARGISCNGQFESSEKAVLRQKKLFRESVVKYVQQLNEDIVKKPSTAEVSDGIKLKKGTLVNDTIIIDVALNKEAANGFKERFEPMRPNFIKTTCTNQDFSKAFKNGYSIEHVFLTEDNAKVTNIMITPADCSQAQASM